MDEREREKERDCNGVGENGVQDTTEGRKREEEEERTRTVRELGHVQRYKALVIYFGLPRPEPIPRTLFLSLFSLSYSFLVKSIQMYF